MNTERHYYLVIYMIFILSYVFIGVHPCILAASSARPAGIASNPLIRPDNGDRISLSLIAPAFAADTGPNRRYIRSLGTPSRPTTMDDIRRKRLLFRSWHRGCKEADLILGSFAEAHLARFSEAQLDRYEALLEEDDAVILDWLMRKVEPPAERVDDVLLLLLAFRFKGRAG
jgi:antitoxin CptB